ncbi:preprotein translocase subunit SecE, partial [Candidatus Phytoplasma aurantifolia]|nr:preprotein translocase subunit SecE [Candidatus Phytoplasma aurantifolia]
FFLISIFPFVRNIFFDLRLVSFPTKIQIIKQIIQVFVFTVILILILNLFQYFYDVYMISLLKKN